METLTRNISVDSTPIFQQHFSYCVKMINTGQGRWLEWKRQRRSPSALVQKGLGL